MICLFCFFFFQAEDGIRDAQESRGLGDVYKRQNQDGVLKTTMAGECWQGSRFAYELRKSLWAEHMGISEQDPVLDDPVEAYDAWRNIARTNSEISDQHFPAMPSNRHKTLEQYLNCREMVDLQLHPERGTLENSQETAQEYLEHLKDKVKQSTHPDMSTKEAALVQMHAIQGNLFEFPLDFLRVDLEAGKLMPKGLEKEVAVPLLTFT
eukprot:TRINITY_DN23114_c0_g1_i1.p1 TRINITY_DN23114_c0_g1~~TRINITY_DN23114_c0_g1_i1.p1  ORF type:complete len:209 (+),score=58.81 TRINITY_DN23114_c0_g1_i1:84-710(+)